MAKKIILSQRTKRHIVKSLNSSYVYENNFGEWQTIKTDNTGLNFPRSITKDDSNNIYICDSLNHRIVKLDSNLSYIDSIDVSSIIGKPYAIFYDAFNLNHLFIAGIYHDYILSIAQITTDFSTIIKYNKNLLNLDGTEIPLGISRGFLNEFLISGCFDFIKIDSTFSSAIPWKITGIPTSSFSGENRINGHIKHSDGNLYLNINIKNESRICKVIRGATSLDPFINDGDSDPISKSSVYVSESGFDNTLLILDEDENSVKRYDTNLNFIETIYKHSASTIENDAKEICGLIEVDV